MSNEEEIKKEKIIDLIKYIETLNKIQLTNPILKQKRDMLVNQLISHQLSMGMTFKSLNKNKEEIKETYVNHESIYFTDPLFPIVNQFIADVERYLVEKQREIDDLVTFIVDVITWGEETKSKVEYIYKDMPDKERDLFVEDIKDKIRVWTNKNAKVVEKKVTEKILKDLIKTEEQKNLFRKYCKDTALQLRVLEGKNGKAKNR